MPAVSEELGITRGTVRVDWVNLGEGIQGEYDEDDPDDVNLMRFDVYRHDGNEWEAVDDSSYCTQVTAAASNAKLYELAQIIMNEVYEPVVAGHSIKRMCERLSWIDESGSY